MLTTLSCGGTCRPATPEAPSLRIPCPCVRAIAILGSLAFVATTPLIASSLSPKVSFPKPGYPPSPWRQLARRMGKSPPPDLLLLCWAMENITPSNIWITVNTLLDPQKTFVGSHDTLAGVNGITTVVQCFFLLVRTGRSSARGSFASARGFAQPVGLLSSKPFLSNS